MWESQGVVDRAGGTCTTHADCGLGGEVLLEEQGVVDRAGGTSTTPADCGLSVGFCGRSKGSLIEQEAPVQYLQTVG